MRIPSNLSVFFLCLAILGIDVLAFYWLRSITRLIGQDYLVTAIHVLFWFFTFGLIASIVILKSRLDRLHPQRRHLLITSLYGLTVSSFIPKVIFVIIISVLYFTNFVFSRDQSLLVVPIMGLFSGFLPFFVILYAIFRALYRFKLHHLKIRFSNLPEPFSGLKIVHISDIHLGSFNFRYHIMERAVKLINEQKPDLILFTGDLVNNFAWELKGWSSVMDKMHARLGKFSVLGNHDYGDYSEWKSQDKKKSNLESIMFFHKKIGFRLLLNEAVIIEQNNEEMAVVGVENWGLPPFQQHGDLNLALNQVEHVGFKVLLSHDPTHWEEEVLGNTDISLTLSGHTHGMQAGVQLKSKKWSPIKYKYKHWAGLHHRGQQYLNVNRGLGWVGFPGRLGMRPEITCIEIFTKH